jgi:hypothetical protein
VILTFPTRHCSPLKGLLLMVTYCDGYTLYPPGKLTVCYSLIYPFKMVIFHSYVNVCRRVSPWNFPTEIRGFRQRSLK